MGCCESTGPQPTTSHDDDRAQYLAGDSKFRQIMVYNKSTIMCLIKAASEKTTITESTYDAAFNSAQKKAVSANIEGGGVGIGGGVEKEVTQSAQQSSSWKAAFSGFINAEYVQVKPGSVKPFAIEGEMAYISVVAVGGKRVFITNWPALGASFVFDGDDLNTQDGYEKFKEGKDEADNNPQLTLALEEVNNKRVTLQKEKKEIDDDRNALKSLEERLNAKEIKLDDEKKAMQDEQKEVERVKREQEEAKKYIEEETQRLRELKHKLEPDKLKEKRDKKVAQEMEIERKRMNKLREKVQTTKMFLASIESDVKRN